MAADWYVQVNGKASGPYTAEQLKQAAEVGKLQRTTQVCEGDKKIWVDAGRVKGLFPAAQHDEEPHHARMNSSKTPSHISDDDDDVLDWLVAEPTASESSRPMDRTTPNVVSSPMTKQPARREYPQSSVDKVRELSDVPKPEPRNQKSQDHDVDPQVNAPSPSTLPVRNAAKVHQTSKPSSARPRENSEWRHGVKSDDVKQKSDNTDYVAIQGSDGDFLDEPTRRDRRSLNPDLDFLDFEFTQYATPILIKILWGIALLVAAFAVIGLPIYVSSQVRVDPLMAFVGTFFAAAIAAAIGLLVVRVACEATIVAFKIASHIDKIQGMLAQHTTDRKN